MPTPYQYAAVADVLAAVSSRLYDTGGQWTTDELTDLLTEALQTWNALSQFWRSEMVFSLAEDEWWYDLRTQANTVVPYTVRESTIVKRIQRHLLEPPTPTAWSGSAQFSLKDLLGACQRRQNEALGLSACTIAKITVPANIVRRTFLPDTTIDIRRVCWQPIANDGGFTNKILKQSDIWASRAFDPTYVQAGQAPPLKWMQNAEPPPSFDVDRTPPVEGSYEVLVTQAGPDWSVANTNSLITIPDDWAWVMKWGALADLLSRESNASDPLRASYCRARYEEGVALLRMMPVVLGLRLNDIPMGVGAVKGGDTYKPSWQSTAAGAPTSAYSFMNLLGFGPKPDSSTAYSATVSVCQNAPIDGTYVQVASDDLDTIIDYTQHLAMFKQGGQEFATSVPLYQNLQKRAANYNGKLREMGFFEMPQLDLSVLDEKRNPRFAVGSAPEPPR